MAVSLASLEKKSSSAAPAGPNSIWVKPKVNASNAVDGDEFYKMHGAEGGFICKIGCVSCGC